MLSDWLLSVIDGLHEIPCMTRKYNILFKIIKLEEDRVSPC